LEQRIVVFVEEVEAGIVAALMLDRLRQFVELLRLLRGRRWRRGTPDSGGWRPAKFAQCGRL